MTLREAREVGRALVTGFDGLLATFSFDTGVIGILVSDLGLCYGHSIAVWLVVVILPFFRFPLVRPMELQSGQKCLTFVAASVGGHSRLDQWKWHEREAAHTVVQLGSQPAELTFGHCSSGDRRLLEWQCLSRRMCAFQKAVHRPRALAVPTAVQNRLELRLERPLQRLSRLRAAIRKADHSDCLAQDKHLLHQHTGGFNFHPEHGVLDF